MPPGDQLMKPRPPPHGEGPPVGNLSGWRQGLETHRHVHVTMAPYMSEAGCVCIAADSSRHTVAVRSQCGCGRTCHGPTAAVQGCDGCQWSTRCRYERCRQWAGRSPDGIAGMCLRLGCLCKHARFGEGRFRKFWLNPSQCRSSLTQVLSCLAVGLSLPSANHGAGTLSGRAGRWCSGGLLLGPPLRVLFGWQSGTVAGRGGGGHRMLQYLSALQSFGQFSWVGCLRPPGGEVRYSDGRGGLAT